MEFDMASVAESLGQAVLLLSQNAWIYNFKLTRFFLDRVWKSVPVEWHPVLHTMTLEQMSEIPFGGCQPGWPSSLNQFIRDCLSLSLSRNLAPSSNLDSVEPCCQGALTDVSPNHTVKQTEDFDSDQKLVKFLETLRAQSQSGCALTDQFVDNSQPLKATDIDGEIRKGMSEKKLHEVCHMTSLIDHVTKKSGCNAVVDVGSGLGYLGQVLHSKFDHPVLGLEGKQCHTAGAEKRIIQDSFCSHLHNVTCELQPTEESNQALLSLIKDWFNNQGGSTCCDQTGSRYNAARNLSNSPPCDTSSLRSQSSDISGQGLACDYISSETNGRTQDTNFVETESYQVSKKDNASANCHEFDGNLRNYQKCRADTESKDALEGNDNMSERGCVDCTNMLDSVTQTKINPMDCTANASEDCTASLPNDCTASLPNDCMASLPNDCMVSLHISAELTNNDTGSKVDQDIHICQCCKESRVRKEWKELMILQAELQQPQVCMVGLHCCGDLTTTMLKCFRDIECIRSLCCVSCCYHRMKYDELSGQFENFPMSNRVKDMMNKVPGWNPGLYGMRLAAQETRARWKGQTSDDHDFHVRNVAYRGLLEVCLEKGKFYLKKASRKLAHQKDFKDFTVYVEAVSKHIDIPATEDEHVHLKSFKEEMRILYSEYQQYFCYIEPISALQVLLQPVIETLIYLDRKMWLLENGYNCDIIPIFNEFISPRNLALVAVK